MNLYKISQTTNTDYDTWNAAVVMAESAEEARHIHPGGRCIWDDSPANGGWINSYDHEPARWHGWTDPVNVTVQLIGTSLSAGPNIIVASFNAG